MTDSRPSWIGRTIGNRYRIEERLGRGGMSSVYKATDPNLQRSVAVKIIHPHLSEHPEFVKRFVQEAAAVAQLRHPNIIQVHDFNNEGDTYYMILEHVPGETLEERLISLKQANLRLPLSETIHILANLCDAVAYAHERNMVHRDLKPSNVIINLLGEPILMDFGIAKLVGGDRVHTATGATIGTAAYMAPEQVMGEGVDHRADIYSLGIMLFEMASGQQPYQGKSALTVMMKHVKEPIPDIRILNSNVPDVLVGILEKALAKNADNRFSSAIEMGTALRMLGQQSLESTSTQIYVESETAVPDSPTPPQAEPVAPPVKPAADEEPAAVEEAPPPLKEPLNRRLLAGIVVLILILGAGAAFLWPRLFPALPPSTGMVQIPAGTYTVGQGNGGSHNALAQSVDLLAYWLDEREVTNADYAEFISDKNADTPAGWANGAPPTGQELYPVQGVTWEMAQAYCRWADKRLPTEAEWEAAARGPDVLLYPWGDDPRLVSLPAGGSYATGTIPANRSVFNAFDMAGNVWEWVDSPYTAVPSGQQVLRGGAYDNQRDLTYRLVGDPDVPTMRVTAGFRCAATEVEIVPATDVLVEEEFTDPESGWKTMDDGRIFFGYHQPDFYHVQAGQPETLSTSFFGGQFDDITMEALVFVDAVDTEDGDFRYGLIVRQNEEDYYAFTISPRAETWYALQHTAAGLAVLEQGDAATLHGLAGGIDRLRVDVSGDEFAFAINGRLVTQFSADGTTSGDIGFLVETFDETRAHVHYDRLIVRPAVYDPTSAAVAAVPASEPTVELAAALPTAESTLKPTTASTEPSPAATPLPSLPSSTSMVWVDGGTYDVGDNTAVTINPFWIDQYEVSNGRFTDFLSQSGQDTGVSAGPDNHPVHGVTWEMANAYCQGAGKRLPTEAEWVAAARGPHGWLYPWGDERTAVSLPASGTYPIGSIPTNRSFFGAFDMAGNVWEWVGDPALPILDGQRVLRGGANSFQQDLTQRLPGDPNSSVMTADAGFRCAAGQVSPAEDTTLLLGEDFADIASGWWQARTPVDAYFYGYHPSDFYHVQVSAPDDCLSINHDTIMDNFMAEVQIFIASTETEAGNFRYGLILRQSDNQFYAFVVSPREQTWHIFKGLDDGLSLLAEGSAFLRGKAVETRDRLFVIANGPEMTFFVNGSLVSRVVDADYENGRLGFIVDTLDETYAHIHFDSVRAWALPDGLAVADGGEETAVQATDHPICRCSVVAGDTLVSFISHTVAEGESITSITQQYNVTEEAIMGANGKTLTDPNLIRPGQIIIIPQS